MRQVVSLSFSAQKAKKIKSLAKKQGFDSVSAYVSHLVDMNQEELISAEELLEAVKEGDREYEAGETITAKSLLDLL